MVPRIECSHCQKIWEPEIGPATQIEPGATESDPRQVILFCPFCDKATKTELDSKWLPRHHIDRNFV